MAHPHGMKLRLLEAGMGALQGVHRAVAGVSVALRGKIAFGQPLSLRGDDVFLCAYPESGVELLQMMVHQLRGDGGMDIHHIDAVVPWYEKEMLGGKQARLEALPSPRVFKTHLLYGLVPRGARYVFVLRDLREVYAASYRLQCLLMGRRLPPAAFARQFRQHKPYLGTWFEHLLSWWPHLEDPGVLLLTHEEMTADLAGTVRRVAAFCGLPLDESRLPRILERLGPDFLRQHEAKLDPRLYETEPMEAFIRRGKTGLWQDELPAPQRERLESRARELARKLGGGGGDPFRYLLAGPGESL